MTDTLVSFEDVARARTTRPSASRSTSSSTPRPRCSAAARPSSAPSPTPRSARPAWACPARCRSSTARPSSRRSGSGWRSTARSREWCRFARKNYFYPDMPKNFQTSQYDEPIAFEGWTESRSTGETVPRRDRARPHGGGHRQVAARRRRHRPHPRRRLLAGRLQPRRHPADRDRHQADPRHRREGARWSPRRTSRSCATCCSGSASPTPGWTRARCAAT